MDRPGGEQAGKGGVAVQTQASAFLRQMCGEGAERGTRGTRRGDLARSPSPCQSSSRMAVMTGGIMQERRPASIHHRHDERCATLQRVRGGRLIGLRGSHWGGAVTRA